MSHVVGIPVLRNRSLLHIYSASPRETPSPRMALVAESKGGTLAHFLSGSVCTQSRDGYAGWVDARGRVVSVVNGFLMMAWGQND